MPAQAQTPPICKSRAMMVQILKKKYNEQSTSLGVTTTGGLVEVFTSPDQNSWTITVTTPKGITCLVAAGTNWQKRKYIETDPGI